MIAPVERSQESQRPKEGPSLVYFWGPVRPHVNRVALEYARRLHQAPIWLNVPEAPIDPTAPQVRASELGATLYTLGAGEDIAAATDPEGTGPAPAVGTVDRTLATEVGRYLRYPPAVRAALHAVATRDGPTVLVITNIDLLGHLPLLTEFNRSRALLQTMRARGVTVVVTSQALIHAPPLPMECAFRVESEAAETWSDAELWPGIPVSSCSTCGGSESGEYAACSPHLRSVCPLRIPFPHDGVTSTDADVGT